MDEFPEKKCPSCGSNLVDPQFNSSVWGIDPNAQSRCGNCGCIGEQALAFWWPTELRACVVAEWSEGEMNELRLDPRFVVEEKLNPWLCERGKGKIELEEYDGCLRMRWIPERGERV